MSHDNNVLLSRYTLGNVLATPDFDTLKHLMTKDVNKISKYISQYFFRNWPQWPYPNIAKFG